jgi:CubicO group peptidase (beta-lactamase class C family)
MTRTTYAQPLPERYRSDVASGHGDDGAPMPGGWMIASEMAAGGLFSTPRDYAAFLLAARAAYHGESGAILGHSLSREMMTREARGVFGLGFRVLGDGTTTRINHGGSSDGYQSETNLFLESGDGGVVLTNATSGLFLYREVHNALADVYGWPDFMPEPKHLHQMTHEEMERLTGDFRILAGIELPRIKVWIEGDRLLSQVPGLRFGVQEVFCDVDGVLFNQTGPFETHVTYGPDGRAASLEVREGGVPMIRAEREG